MHSRPGRSRRGLDEHHRPGAIANAVRNAVKNSMKGQEASLVERAILQARQEADLSTTLPFM